MPLRADYADGHFGGRERDHGQRQDRRDGESRRPTRAAAGRLPPGQVLRPFRPARRMRRVVLADQRLGVGVGADDPGDRADVTARVEATAVRGEVVALDGADQSFADAGARADVRDGQPGPAPRSGQGLADAHTR